MARRTTNTKAQAQAEATKDWREECMNTVAVEGKVRRVLANTDKVLKFSVDVANKTDKGNWVHSFLTVTSFTAEDDVKEGDMIYAEGYLATSSYNGKYSTEIVATKLYTVEA